MKNNVIKLRPLKMKDAEFMLEWMTDPKVNCFFGDIVNKATLESCKGFIEKSRKEFEAGTTLHYAVVDETDEYQGTVSLKEINKEMSEAEFAISLRYKAQGKGTGRAAVREILMVAFEELKLKMVYLNVLEDNPHAVQFYQKVGFCPMEKPGSYLVVGGKEKKLLWFTMTEEEYRENKAVKSF